MKVKAIILGTLTAVAIMGSSVANAGGKLDWAFSINLNHGNPTYSLYIGPRHRPVYHNHHRVWRKPVRHHHRRHHHRAHRGHHHRAQQRHNRRGHHRHVVRAQHGWHWHGKHKHRHW